MQRHVRLSANEAEQIIAMGLDSTGTAIPAPGSWGNLALGFEARHLAHRAGDADPETLGRRVARHAARTTAPTTRSRRSSESAIPAASFARRGLSRKTKPIRESPKRFNPLGDRSSRLSGSTASYCRRACSVSKRACSTASSIWRCFSASSRPRAVIDTTTPSRLLKKSDFVPSSTPDPRTGLNRNGNKQESRMLFPQKRFSTAC
jgi:hypothetical protein